jgi:hypothetical protein
LLNWPNDIDRYHRVKLLQPNGICFCSHNPINEFPKRVGERSGTLRLIAG